jgi:hypothetical protein
MTGAGSVFTGSSRTSFASDFGSSKATVIASPRGAGATDVGSSSLSSSDIFFDSDSCGHVASGGSFVKRYIAFRAGNLENLGSADNSWSTTSLPKH